jgi:hypothetical protein
MRFPAAMFTYFLFNFKPQNVHFEEPALNEQALHDWVKYKIRWHKYGFVLFIIGLILMAATSIFDPTTNSLSGADNNND